MHSLGYQQKNISFCVKVQNKKIAHQDIFLPVYAIFLKEWETKKTNN